MNIITRDQWSAQPANRSSAAMSDGDAEAIFIHWNGPAIWRTGAAMPQAIQRYHLGVRTTTGSKKYADVAYSFLVGRDGNVYEGRGWGGRDGATSSVWHGKSYSIFVATGTGQKVPLETLVAVKELVGEIKRRTGKALPVKAHRDAYGTACPGDELTDWIRRGMPVDTDKPKPVPPADLSPAAPEMPPLGNTVLRRGDWRNILPWRKRRVEALQRALGYLGFGLVGTGPWGDATQDAVIRFQRVMSIKVDGLVGPKTWAKLSQAVDSVSSFRS